MTRNHLLVLCLAFAGCMLDVTPDPELEVESSEQALCTVSNEYREWLRDYTKVPHEWCSTGFYTLSNDEQTQAISCVWQGSSTTLLRGLGLRRQGLSVSGRVSYDTFACQFGRCNLYIGIVTCSCNGCNEPISGTQQYYP